MAPGTSGQKRRRSTSSAPESIPALSSTELIRSLFENKDRSDLTIELSDGRTIPVHKIVLCGRNTYFNASCGLDSQFAEGQEKEIKLLEDDPDAVLEVVRHIYDQPIEDYKKHPWAYWLTLLEVADKYRELGLMKKASMAMLRWGRDLARYESRRSGDIEEVCAILEGFRDIDSDHKVFVNEYALAKEIELYTHGSERFRSYLLSRPSILLKLHADWTLSSWWSLRGPSDGSDVDLVFGYM